MATVSILFTYGRRTVFVFTWVRWGLKNLTSLVELKLGFVNIKCNSVVSDWQQVGSPEFYQQEITQPSDFNTFFYN